MARFARCIVHAGSHKTGTTTVQRMMAAQRAPLAASGVHYPALDREDRDHNPLAHRLATCGDDDLVLARAQLAAHAGDAHTLLLSAEEFSTRIGNPHPWAGFDDGAYWEHRRQYLQRLRQVLADAERIEVYLCFRDHESYAHALYATKIVSGQIDWDFAQFVSRCAPIFDYRRQVEVLEQTLGPVRVVGWEQLRGDLANRFFAWLEVPIRTGHAPRIRPTPTLDLIHWLARTAPAQVGGDEFKRRAAFCREHRGPPGAAQAAVPSLWPTPQARQDFLRLCHAPPLEGWPPMAAAGPVADIAALDRRADEIEAEYRQWLRAPGGLRKHWWAFWRRR